MLTFALKSSAMAYNSFLQRYYEDYKPAPAPEPMAVEPAAKKKEKRSISLSDPRFWSYFGLGNTSLANVDVTQHTSLGVPPFFCAVRYIVEGVAMLDRNVKRTTIAGVEDAKGHPVWQWMNYKPHPHYTWFDLICALLTNACLGNGYARIHWDYSTMRPMYLEHIPSIFCRPEYDYSGNLWYVITGNVNGRTVIERLPPTDIIHIKGLSLDGILGLDVTVTHQATMATGIARQQYTESVLGKGARPSIAIKQEEQLESPEEAANIEENLMRRIGGTEQAGRPLVLDAGQEIQYIQWSPLEAALEALAALNVEDVARITKVPRDLLALDTHGTYGAGVQRSQDFLTHCLGPWNEKIQEEFNTKLFHHSEAVTKSVYFKFDVAMYLALDKKAESEMLAREVAGTIRTPNEARAVKGLPPKEGGDQLMIDINLLPINQAVEVALAKYLSSVGEKGRNEQQQQQASNNKTDGENEPDAKPATD